MKNKSGITDLARQYSTLNGWEWPDNCLWAKPDNWDNLPFLPQADGPSRHDIITRRMYAIEFLIGKKECLRYHHVYNLKMKNWQFELWWIFSRNIKSPLWFDIYSLMRWRTAYD